MRAARTAKVLGINKSTVFRRLRFIYKKSKLNPCNFDELVMLIQLIEVANDDKHS